MAIFPANTFSNSTTLLPTTKSLPGDWQVALIEIAWPAMVQNVTLGQFTVLKQLPASPQEKKFQASQTMFDFDDSSLCIYSITKTLFTCNASSQAWLLSIG